MNHLPLEELTSMIHGLEPLDPHLDDCDSCRRTAGRLTRELALFRRAEARVRAPSASPGRLARALPPSIAAAILLAIVGAILLRGPETPLPGRDQETKQPSTREIVRLFLDGDDAASTRARRELVALGPSALFDLLEARRKRPNAARRDVLSELILECKTPPAQDRSRPVCDKIKSIRITIDMQNAPVTAVLDYIREISGVNIVFDTSTDGSTVMVCLKLADVVLPTALDHLLEPRGLDYGFRQGVLFVGPPDRLWAAPAAPSPIPALLEGQAKAARAWISQLSAENPEERERAFEELRKLGPAGIPLLKEGTRASDAEVASRCGALLDELSPRTPAWGSIPPHNRWRTQKLADSSRDAAVKLETMKVDLAFERTDFSEILSFLRDFSGLNYVVQGRLPKEPLTFRVKDLLLGDVLELLTLPNGLDVRLEGGVITIADQKK